MFFTGKADPQVYKDTNFDLKVLRQDVDKFIDADEEVIKSKQKIEYLYNLINIQIYRTLYDITNIENKITNFDPADSFVLVWGNPKSNIIVCFCVLLCFHRFLTRLIPN